MNEYDVAKRLNYNMEYYKIYKQNSSLFDSKYLTFEQFLLLGNNLEEYFADSEAVCIDYNYYHEYQDPNEYESFEVFCRKFKIFPYDLKLIEDKRCCENCAFYNTQDSTIGFNIPPCNFDTYELVDDPCTGHIFDTEKGRRLIKECGKNIPKSN